MTIRQAKNSCKKNKYILIYILLMTVISLFLTSCSNNNIPYSTKTNVKNEITDENKTKNGLDEKVTIQGSVSNIKTVQSVVTRVVDGDTIELKSGQIVRLINVNTPESTNKIEKYGKESSQFTNKSLLGKTVWLTKDISETDRYGRLLRFIWMKKPDNFSEKEFRANCFNAMLVLKGYAMSYSYNPDITYSNYFKKFDREAYAKKIGLWQFGEFGTTKGDYSAENRSNLDTKNDSDSTKEPSSTTIVFYTPNGKSYHKFKNCPTLSRSKKILSGPLSEAETQGHQGPCDFCYK